MGDKCYRYIRPDKKVQTYRFGKNESLCRKWHRSCILREHIIYILFMINISDMRYAQGVVYLKTAPFYFTEKWENFKCIISTEFQQNYGVNETKRD